MTMMEAMKQFVIVIPMNISNAPVDSAQINRIVAMEVNKCLLNVVLKISCNLDLIML